MKAVSSLDNTTARFEGLNREKSYEFVIHSYNTVGFSHNATRVFLPMATNSKNLPCAFPIHHLSPNLNFNAVFPAVSQCHPSRKT